ncbi:hypothetical protein EON64_05020 [archaeon]|nr:MAG: hypothetical protein EON64_05020 [archaeon]
MIGVVVCLLAALAVCFGAADTTAYDKVNVFIASGGLAYGYGSINPGAQMPFGAMRLGPDTTIKAADVGYRHFSGYNSQDNVVRAFSHTHLFGAGVNDLGNFGIMPFNLRNTDDLLSNVANFWWSKFSKDTEKGSPGYYAVSLQEPNVDVQLIAVNNLVGVHKYTWKDLKSSKLQLPGLVLDICHAAKLKTGGDNPCLDATLNIDPTDNNKFSGAVSFDGSFTSGMWIYVAGEISTDSPAIKPSAWRFCSGQNITSTECGENTGRVSSTSGNLFGLQTFTPASKTFLADTLSVTVKVAISFISEDQARVNLNSSPAHGNNTFDTLRAHTQAQWSNVLNTMSVSALENEDLDILMHSAHYRTLCGVADYTEEGGIYKGADGQLHNVVTERAGYAANSAPESLRFYSDLSLWDTFRTLHPFLLLTQEPLSVGTDCLCVYVCAFMSLVCAA